MNARPWFWTALLVTVFLTFSLLASNSASAQSAVTGTAAQDPAIPVLQKQTADLDARMKTAEAAIAALQPRPPTVRPDDVLGGIDPKLDLNAQTLVFGYESDGRNQLSSSVPPRQINGASDTRPRYQRVTQDGQPALLIQQFATDANVGGYPRAEFNLSRDKTLTPAVGATYWRAWQQYLPAAWATTAGTQLIAQVHNEGSGARNPPIALKAINGRFRLDARSSDVVPTMTPEQQVTRVGNADLGAVITGRWVPFEMMLKTNPAGVGRLQVWIDGKLAHDYSGPLGYAAGTHYYKQGIYPLQATSLSTYLRGPWFIKNGDAYTAEQVRSFVAGR